MNWEKYYDGRLIKKCDGFFVIKGEKDLETRTPLVCPVCDYLMRNSDDEKSYIQFGCCESCELVWARPHREIWDSGWRPDKKIVQEKMRDNFMNVTINF